MKLSHSDSGFSQFDASRFSTLPELSLAEAAWLAGVAEEALQSYLQEANALPMNGMISVQNLCRAVFTLLGRMENQALLLRQQLSLTLDREKELSETLRSGLLLSAHAASRTQTVVKSVAHEMREPPPYTEALPAQNPKVPFSNKTAQSKKKKKKK